MAKSGANLPIHSLGLLYFYFMKVLVFGSSGSGKSFVSQALRDEGINAWDADEVEGLASWYDAQGIRVPPPSSAREAMDQNFRFLWDKAFLARILNLHSNLYLFGGSGNLFDVVDLFDRVYYLTIDPVIQMERLRARAQSGSGLVTIDDMPVLWGQWLEKEAIKRNIPTIDGSWTPKIIWEIIRQ